MQSFSSKERMLSGFEIIIGLASVFGVLWFASTWYRDLVTVNRFAPNTTVRVFLAFFPVACVLGMLLFLMKLSASDVRGDTFWTSFYVLVSGAWLGLSTRVLTLLGLSIRDDVLERTNAAALCACTAGVVAFLLCFAGGNVGDGPGVEVVLLSGGVASVVVALIWLLLDRLTGIVDRITIERETAAGIRGASVLLALGLINGMAASGDWHAEKFAAEFIGDAWPSLFVAAAAFAVEKVAGDRISVLASTLVAIAIVGSASGYVLIRTHAV
jgi:hypothetical protein